MAGYRDYCATDHPLNISAPGFDIMNRMYRYLIGILLCTALIGQQRPMAPEDQFSIRDVGEIRISPDGATILYTESTRSVQENKTTSRLMKIAATGGAPEAVRGAPEGADNIRWSPDGTRIAFFASKDRKRAVWVLHSGKLTRVCDYDRGNSFLSKSGSALAWSPDGKQLAFAGTLEPKPGTQDPLVISRILYKTRTAFSDNRRSHLFVVAASGGKPRQITKGDFDEHSIDWGGDGSEIVFLSNRERDPDANYNYDIFAVNVSTGAERRITQTPGVEMDPVVSPDGRWIAYDATKRERTTIDSVAEDAHIWVVPYSGGAARELNASLDRRSTSAAWSPDSRSVIYVASDRGKSLIYRTPLEGGPGQAIVDRQAAAGPFSVAKNGSIALGIMTATMPREVFVLKAAGGEPEQLTSINAAILRNWKLSNPQTVRFPSFDGTEIEGWLYPPVGESTRWPMILTIHGGPHGMFGYTFSASTQAYAGRGYAVLALNPRGSAGYGQKFSDGCVNDWGGGDYKDLMAGVDYALSKHPIDAARMGVTGSSYGGFMTNWVVTQTNRFHAAVTSASLSNLISFYATSLYQDLIHVEFNGYPWERDNFATLWKWSPLAHVTKVTTPLLLLHGEQDNDVHITQAEEMYTALRQRGNEAVLVRYPREGHGFREPKHVLDSLRRTLDWMDRYLAVKRPTG
jgi:dipeptidyl aminopeptidase/acylaminoacyl peptidase